MGKSGTDNGSVQHEGKEVPGLKPLKMGFPGTADALDTRQHTVSVASANATVLLGDNPDKKSDSEPAPLEAVVIFRDTVFTSRVLILPGERQLAVAKGHVTVRVSDTEALAYLQNRADFEQLLE